MRKVLSHCFRLDISQVSHTSRKAHACSCMLICGLRAVCAVRGCRRQSPLITQDVVNHRTDESIDQVAPLSKLYLVP